MTCIGPANRLIIPVRRPRGQFPILFRPYEEWYTAKTMHIIQMIMPFSIVVPNKRSGRQRKYVKSDALEDSIKSHTKEIAVHSAYNRQKIFRTII